MATLFGMISVISIPGVAESALSLVMIVDLTLFEDSQAPLYVGKSVAWSLTSISGQTI